MWEGGCFGIFQSTRRIIKILVKSAIYDNALLLCVLMNTIVLTLDGYLDENERLVLNEFNFSFTIIFAGDMFLKLYGMGVEEYTRDSMNVFDAIIVILSFVELAIKEEDETDGASGNSAVSSFRSVRIFRAFRVFRVTRMVRSLEYMRVIMNVIAKTLEDFFYIFLLLILFNYIFALLGM